MRVTVNLASRPFVELRPVYLRLRIAMAALVLLGIALGIANHLLGAKAAAAARQMEQVRKQTLVVESERQANERRMQQPQNRAVLERSQFLNGLFQRKSFSWTSVMMDLERVLPPGVQVTSIEPVVTPEGEVNIRLRVSGERDHAIELVRNLERSQRFINPHLANESAQAQEKGRAVNVAAVAPGAVEFDILSGYKPLPEPGQSAHSGSDGTPGHAHPQSAPGAHSAMRAAKRSAGPSRPPLAKPNSRSGGAR